MPAPIKDDKEAVSHQGILGLLQVLGNPVQFKSKFLSHISVKSFILISLLWTNPDSLTCDNEYHKTCFSVLFFQSCSPAIQAALGSPRDAMEREKRKRSDLTDDAVV